MPIKNERLDAVLLLLVYLVFAYRRVQSIAPLIPKDKATRTQEKRSQRSRTLIGAIDNSLADLVDCECDQLGEDLDAIADWPDASWWSGIRSRCLAYLIATCQEESGKDSQLQSQELKTILEGLRLRANQITLSTTTVETLTELLRKSP